ncbi:MAG: hypothetical protein ACKO1K_09040, partial [Burkholderiales bacterium]
WPPVPAFGQQVDAFLLHPFGDSNKSIETGVQSSLQPVYAMSTAGNRITGASAARLAGAASRLRQRATPKPAAHWINSAVQM